MWGYWWGLQGNLSMTACIYNTSDIKRNISKLEFEAWFCCLEDFVVPFQELLMHIYSNSTRFALISWGKHCCLCQQRSRVHGTAGGGGSINSLPADSRKTSPVGWFWLERRWNPISVWSDLSILHRILVAQWMNYSLDLFFPSSDTVFLTPSWKIPNFNSNCLGMLRKIPSFKQTQLLSWYLMSQKRD